MVEIVAVVALGTQPFRFSPSGRSLGLSLALLVIATWMLMRQHERRLCEQCVAEIPLDVERAAEKARWRFRLAHAGARPSFVVPYLGFLLATNFIPTAEGRLIWAAAQLTMIYLVLASTTHHKLQPWCPMCREDGGGDHEDLNSPLPPDRDRQLI